MNKTLTGDDIDKHQRVYDESDDVRETLDSSGSENTERDELSGDNLALTSPIVYGFSLADKLWRKFIATYKCTSAHGLSS